MIRCPKNYTILKKIYIIVYNKILQFYHMITRRTPCILVTQSH